MIPGMSGPEIRPVTTEELPGYCRTIEAAFGHHLDEVDLAWQVPMVEADRTLAVYEGGRMVGTAGAYSMEITVPGLRSVSMAGVTAVSVQPTHRRRGLLRALMRHQLDDLQAAGEAIAGLTASQSLIYGRFGYGLAVALEVREIAPRHSAFARPVPEGGRFTMLDANEAAKVIPDLQERIRRLQVGDATPMATYWDAYFQDPKSWHEDTSARFYVLHESDAGEPDGYASYRTKAVDSEDGNDLHVDRLRALDADTEAQLWRFVLDIDLVGKVVTDWRAPDDALAWRLLDPRRLRRAESSDALWIRLVALPDALESRRYRADGTVVLDVVDEFCPWNQGRWVLEIDGGRASCRRADGGRAADLVLSAAELGASYLGGVSFTTLARAGRVDEERAGVLAAADAMFGTDRLPWCSMDF